MSGYDRQSVADIVANEVIKAAPLNAEFNALRDAFILATGHKHDGSATEGAYVPLISDTDGYNKVVIDSSNNRVQFFVEVSSAAAEQMRLQDGALVPVVDNDIDLGTTTLEFKDLYLDGTAKVDTLTVDENATIAGTLNVTGAVVLSGNLTVNGNTVIGDAATDTVTVTADVASPLIPSADDTYDIGAVGSEWRNLYVDGTANIDSLIADTADIDGGTIDGTTIGGNSAAAGSFTTLAASSTATLSGNTTVGGTLGVTSATTLSSTLTVTGTATFNGNTVIGDATSDTVTITARAASDFVPSTDDARDLGSAALEWRDLYIDGTANIDSLVADTADINGGTVDGAIIGGNSAAAGTFTNLTSSGTSTHATVDINGGNIDGTIIGAASAAAITGTTITANSGFTGNITSSGTSSFATVTTSGNVTIGGDLTVNGTTTTISTTNTVVEDAIIELAHGTTGSPTSDAGIVIERGTEANAFIGFDESADKFIVGTGSFTGASTGDLTITTGTLIANLEGNVTGNVTGDLSGNVTGNVTGNVSGNITSTGTSTFTTIDVNGGSIDGATIGAASAAAGTFTSVNASGTITYGSLSDGVITITAFVDEDNMASNSATLVPTQQSVKAYVDTVAGQANNVVGLTATGAELNVLDGDTSPASVTLVGTDGFPVNDAGVTKLALISDISTYIQGQTVSFTNATLTTPTVSGLYLSDSGFVVEGSSSDANETTVTFTNPTADRTITFPDATGTVLLSGDIGVSVQAYDAGLADIAGLAVTDGNFIVGNGTNWVAESGDTAILSLGVTATAAELNILDGVTSTASELNLVDGSVANTVVNSKAVIYGASGEITANQIDILAQGDLRLQDTTGGQYVALQAPGTVSSSFTLTLPAADGTNGQVLQTNGSGTLSFATAASATINEFTASGTYTKPSGANFIMVEVWGAGGGGGGGSRGGGVNCSGGGGGGGGAYNFRIFKASDVGATETVTIGAGGAGGAGATTNNTSGVDGSSGGNTTFGVLLTAYGGGEGTKGVYGTSVSSGGAGGGTLRAASLNTIGLPRASASDGSGFGGGAPRGASAADDHLGSSGFGGGGGGSSSNAVLFNGGSSSNGGAGGGPGGGFASSGSTYRDGGAGGSNSNGGGGGGAGGATGSPGVAGTAGTGRQGGGGGGASQGSGPGGAGGAGGIASGGGGGGMGTTGNNGGAGGAGGAGRCIVYTW